MTAKTIIQKQCKGYVQDGSHDKANYHEANQYRKDGNDLWRDQPLFLKQFSHSSVWTFGDFKFAPKQPNRNDLLAVEHEKRG